MRRDGHEVTVAAPPVINLERATSSSPTSTSIRWRPRVFGNPTRPVPKRRAARAVRRGRPSPSPEPGRPERRGRALQRSPLFCHWVRDDAACLAQLREGANEEEVVLSEPSSTSIVSRFAKASWQSSGTTPPASPRSSGTAPSETASTRRSCSTATRQASSSARSADTPPHSRKPPDLPPALPSLALNSNPRRRLAPALVAKADN